VVTLLGPLSAVERDMLLKEIKHRTKTSIGALRSELKTIEEESYFEHGRWTRRCRRGTKETLRAVEPT